MAYWQSNSTDNKASHLYLRRYELQNHLGNVGVVIGDYKNLESDHYVAALQATSHYYPFGMELSNKQYRSGESYRFG